MRIVLPFFMASPFGRLVGHFSWNELHLPPDSYSTFCIPAYRLNWEEAKTIRDPRLLLTLGSPPFFFWHRVSEFSLWTFFGDQTPRPIGTHPADWWYGFLLCQSSSLTFWRTMTKTFCFFCCVPISTRFAVCHHASLKWLLAIFGDRTKDFSNAHHTLCIWFVFGDYGWHFYPALFLALRSCLDFIKYFDQGTGKNVQKMFFVFQKNDGVKLHHNQSKPTTVNHI